MTADSLLVIESHPVQYHAPVYRALQQDHGIDVTALYGSDFSVSGYFDSEFGTDFAWDTDLLSGYSALFVRRVSEGGPRSFEEVSSKGIGDHFRRLNPRAVLLTGYASPFDREAIRVASRSSAPLLFRGETTDHATSRGLVKRTLRDAALRRFYRRCAGLLYIGHRSRAHYERLGCPSSKLFFSPYCVDPTPFSTDEASRRKQRTSMRRALQVDDDAILILFSGKLSPRKAPHLIIESVRLLNESDRSRVIVALLGSGELESSLRAIAEKPPKVNVLFLGFRNQSELSPYYHAADVLVLSSVLGETWGLVVNEALHHGLPCVVSDSVGCAPDLVDSPILGRTFSTGSARSLSQSLTAVLGEPGGVKERDFRRQRAEQYGVQKAAEGISSAYRSTINLS